MLTERQQAVLDFIREQQSATGITPSTREVQQHFDYASQTSVVDILHALERKGALQRHNGKARALILQSSRNRAPIIDIPLYGAIPAGMPSPNEQQADTCISIDAESLRIPKNARTFALKVRGDSMINAGIHDGDVVMMEFKEPRNGDIVAALIDGETTLKRYVLRRGKPFLKAENPKYPDLIPARELVIQGVQIALLRIAKN